MGRRRQGVGRSVTSEWDDTPWGGIAVPAKAVTGPFASRVEYGTPLSSLSRTPQRKMRDAQVLYHTNPWIRTAEATVTRKVVGLDWHLENQNDDEISEDAGGIEGSVRMLLERPQALLNVGRRMTRRELWAITSRHIGLCGMAYWYLDQMEPTARTPLGILYVNPARVWAATDDTDNLTGWVLDPKDDTGRGGTPLALDELLPFYLDPPDWGHYGSGLVEAAWQKAQITTLADRHAAYILGTGGRLPGIVSPKDGTIPDEQYKALVQEFRNVNEAPDAAKRTTVVRGPIDFTGTSSDPSELMLIELSKMNRDDIFAVWGVPPSQAGVPPAHGGGLNSGEAQLHDEAVLMQGAVHDRVISIVETLQYNLIDRYKALGLTVEIEVDNAPLVDNASLYDNVSKAINVALTNDERREIIGFPPLLDPVAGAAILLPLTLTPFDGKPEPVAPVVPPPPKMIPNMMPNMPMGKADGKFLGLRSKMEARFVPSLRKSLTGVLAEQRGVIASRIRDRSAALTRKHNDTDIWWNARAEDERLAKVLRAGSTGIAQTVARQIDALLSTGKANPVYEDQVVEYVTKRTGERITQINTTTRDAVQDAITQGFEDGLSPLEIAALIEDLPAFDLARAELVARTETMFAYNDAALTSYGEFGVAEVLAYDGDQDEECAARDGQTFSLADSFDILDHPNGTLDWAPVVPGRASLTPLEAAVKALIERPEAPAPIVNNYITSPDAPNVIFQEGETRVIMPTQEPPTVVNNVSVPAQKAPVVTVTNEVPVVNVEVKASDVIMPAAMAITSMPDRVTRREVTKRMKDGGIAETIEVQSDGA